MMNIIIVVLIGMLVTECGLALALPIVSYKYINYICAIMRTLWVIAIILGWGSFLVMIL